MAFTPSPDQESIIKARKQNILVSAAAGSGKTSVLTERIVGLVCDENNPIDIDRVLVVTFTNAAAMEMKERIGNKLNEMLLSDPFNEHLQRQATLIHSAQITTIDSFCLYLVKNHFSEINVDPSFRVGSTGEIKLLKQDVLKDVIKRAYASKDEDFYHIVDCYSKKDSDGTLEESILNLYNFACSYPWPVKWLNDKRKDYEFETFKDFYESTLLSDLKAFMIKSFETAIYITKEAKRYALLPGGPYSYEKSLTEDLQFYESCLNTLKTNNIDALESVMQVYEAPNIGRAGKDADPNITNIVKDLREKAKKLVKDNCLSVFLIPLSLQYEDLKEAGRVVNKLIDLTIDLYESFNKAKRDRDIIDFSDMEHMAVEILVKNYEDEYHFEITDVAGDYRNHYKEVMVDEYQDSNLVQELIIKAVSREDEEENKNRFCVGDIKQSIYRFRLARPEIFMGKMAYYDKCPDSLNRLICLRSNYRSRKSVIDSVNAVFKNIMSLEQGGVNYDEDAMLYFGATFSPDKEDNKTEVMVVEKGKSKAADSRDTEAEAIALKIMDEIKNREVYDKEEKITRKATFKDVAVLFRSPSGWRNAIKNAFDKYQIPFCLDGVGAFYDTLEISQVISFLRVLNNPLDDISLYASLTSFFGKFTDEDLALYKGKKGKEHRFLWDTLKDYLEFDQGNERLENFIGLINKYRKLSEVLPIHELISRLLDETDYRNIIAAMPDGKHRLSNVELLIGKANEFASTSFYGLFHFLRYVELLKKTETEEGEAQAFDEESDVVRVTSIHKSKGLEFPVCIIGGMDDDFNMKDYSKPFVFDIDDGIGALCINPEKRYKRDTIKRRLICRKGKADTLSEEIRILYVGMTRAKEKLILVTREKDPDEWELDLKLGSTSNYINLIKATVCKNPDLFKITKIYATDITAAVVEKTINREALRLSLENMDNCDDLSLSEKIRDKFVFDYKYKGLETLYTKTTVSEIKMAAIEHEETDAVTPFKEIERSEYVPKFAGGETKVKGTDRGTAYHNLLQLLDFKALPFDKDEKALWAYLYKEKERIVNEHSMSKEDEDKVFDTKIIEFLKSDVAREMSLADKENKLFKEQPFVIGVPASSVEASFPESETLLVQGVIDVYFIKNEKVTVLDYKTDRVEAGDELVKRYKTQLEYYGDAVKQLTGLETEALLIYSFGLNDTIMVK